MEKESISESSKQSRNKIKGEEKKGWDKCTIDASENDNDYDKMTMAVYTAMIAREMKIMMSYVRYYGMQSTVDE